MEEKTEPLKKAGKKRIILTVLIILILLLGAAGAGWYYYSQSRLEEARELLGKGDYQQAAEIIVPIRNFVPWDKDINRNLFEIQAVTGEYDQALESLESFPEDNETIALKALVTSWTGDFEKANQLADSIEDNAFLKQTINYGNTAGNLSNSGQLCYNYLDGSVFVVVSYNTIVNIKGDQTRKIYEGTSDLGNLFIYKSRLYFSNLSRPNTAPAGFVTDLKDLNTKEWTDHNFTMFKGKFYTVEYGNGFAYVDEYDERGNSSSGYAIGQNRISCYLVTDGSIYALTGQLGAADLYSGTDDPDLHVIRHDMNTAENIDLYSKSTENNRQSYEGFFISGSDILLSYYDGGKKTLKIDQAGGVTEFGEHFPINVSSKYLVDGIYGTSYAFYPATGGAAEFEIIPYQEAGVPQENINVPTLTNYCGWFTPDAFIFPMYTRNPHAEMVFSLDPETKKVTKIYDSNGETNEQ